MKESSKSLLEKANRAIQAAEALLEKGFPDFASGRAYCAMFYSAEALLNERDLHFSKHGGVHGAFGEQFVKTGLFDPKFHRWLLDAYDQRIEGDYSTSAMIADQDAQRMIEHTRAFPEAAKMFLAD